MLRLVLSAGTLAFIGLASPASAQMMCSPGQQAQAPGGAMMCGTMGAAQTKPETDTQKPQAGMCPCCRNMAMMRGGSPTGRMPGMDMPKQ